jgi:hypothetical protein
MKLPISIEHDSLQFHTSVLIDSATTLNFVSEDFLTRNNLLGKCSRGKKMLVESLMSRGFPRAKHFNLPMFRLVRKSSLDSNLQSYHMWI